MKARLLYNQETMQLLSCNGKIKTVSDDEARSFLLNFDSPEYYAGDSKWDYENLTIESYRGTTIAFVDESLVLHIEDADQFRKLLTYTEPDYLTVPEYAALHGKQTAIIRRFCIQGRLEGAIQKGSKWLIPSVCPYPVLEKPGRK